MDPEGFVDKSLDEQWYPEKDYHVLYAAEIEQILVVIQVGALMVLENVVFMSLYS